MATSPNKLVWWSCRFLGLYPIRGRRYSGALYWRGLLLLLLLLLAGSLGILREIFVLHPSKRMRTSNRFSGTVCAIDYGTQTVAAVTPLVVGRRSVLRLHRRYSRLLAHFHLHFAARLSAPGVRIAYLLLKIGFILFVVIDTVRWYIVVPNIVVYLPFVLLYFFISDSIVLISTLISVLAMGYAELNEIISKGRFVVSGYDAYFLISGWKTRKMPKPGNSLKVGIGSTGPGCERVRVGLDRVMEGYRLLRSAEEAVRGRWGATVLAGCLAVFTHLFITPYYVVAALTFMSPDQVRLMGLLFAAGQTAFTVFNTALLLFLAVPPSKKSREASKTGYLIATLLDSRLPKHISRKLKRYVIEIYHDTKESGLDMYGLKLDTTLITNMFHSATLYVVILMQFS